MNTKKLISAIDQLVLGGNSISISISIGISISIIVGNPI